MWRISDLQETGSPRKAARTCSEGCSGDAPLDARWQQHGAVGLLHEGHASSQGSVATPPCQSFAHLPSENGNRFFWVGQHHCASDSTDCTDASHLVAAALAPRKECHQQATGLGAASQPGSLFSLSSFIDSGFAPPNTPDSTLPLLPTKSSVPSQRGSWSPSDTPSLCTPSLTMPFLAASDSEALQGLVSEPVLSATSHFLPASPFDTMDMSEDSNMWAAHCLPEDVDKLLDWADDSAADSSFSDPSLNSAQLSMSCYELPLHSIDLQSEASPRPASQQAKLLLVPDLSCDQSSWSLGTQAATPLLYDHPASDALWHQQLASDAHQHQQLVSDTVQHQQLASDAIQHQQLASDAPQQQQVASDTHQHQLLVSDPLGLLIQREQDLCFGALPKESLSGRDSSPSSGSDDQTGVPDVKGGSQMKRRCGRPRVYDLDRPVPADAARAAPKSPQKTKGRGAKPKYIYTTAEEAIAKRRKRNRDTATQSYYNRKQRVSMLANEMAGLKEENAALRTILCVLERGSQADKGWLREQLSAGRSPSSILQELQQTSSWLM
ncbi:MAG: hypothetical protein FRX49_12426 [Trebouxia sp. A1-2]|nr:MAG: hypothetical protein FRX49_12426 [Trebouxia sp. A1-2]